jgi:MFS family permease
METKHKGVASGLLGSFDCITVAIIPLYFLYVSKNWFPLYLLMLILGILSLAFMLFCATESPKWLLTKGRRKDAIAVFNKIAKINQCDRRIPEDATFSEF